MNFHPSEIGTGPPLIAHVIDRLAIGGMENGIVNLINQTPPERYRHAILCLQNADDFRDRIKARSVGIYCLNKQPGKDLGLYLRLWQHLKCLRPTIVHTRNLPTVDLIPVALAAGVRYRIHAEHGRDMVEFRGDNRKYNLLRKTMSPMVQRYITVSQDIQRWLQNTIHISGHKIRQIYNGVDNLRFSPSPGGRTGLPVDDFAPRNAIVIGTVGRMETIKDQITLVKAFIELCTMLPDEAKLLRLALIGEGSLREPAHVLLQEAGRERQAWLPGKRNDIAALLRALDVFVLPSINEGISNTIIEAMATALPVVATRVGGNSELVIEGETGILVPSQDPKAMAQALRRYVVSPRLRAEHGEKGRRRVESQFTLQKMIDNYLSVYDEVLSRP